MTSAKSFEGRVLDVALRAAYLHAAITLVGHGMIILQRSARLLDILLLLEIRVVLAMDAVFGVLGYAQKRR